MEILEVSRVTAIKERELKFNYCSTCHKFRQVHCYLESKSVCVDCTKRRQLALVDPPLNLQEKCKRVTPIKNDEPLRQLRINIVECLKKDSLSSKELYSRIGQKHYQSYDSFIWFLRRLQNEGVIVSRRWLASGPKYHALPDKQHLISQRIGQEPECRVMELLKEVKSMPVSKIGRKIGFSRASAYGICKRIEQSSGKVRLEKAASGQIVASLVDLENSQ